MIAEQHYADANTLFNQLEHWDEVIRLQLEKAGVYEFQLKRMIILCLPLFHSLFILKFDSGLTGVVSKMRILQSILDCYLSTKEALSALAQPTSGGDVPTLELKTSECLLLMCSRIQSTLLQLTKLSKSVKKP